MSLCRDNPYAQRGSGLNNNQNHIFDNLRGYPPRANPLLARAMRLTARAGDPYMFEVQRVRQVTRKERRGMERDLLADERQSMIMFFVM